MKGTNCLGPDQLEALITGLGTEAAQSHVAACTHCQTEFALMKQFVEAEPSAEETVAVRQIEHRLRSAPAWRPAEPESSARSAWWPLPFKLPAMGFAMAGALALILVGVWLGNPSQQGVEPVDSGITRALGVEGVEPAGDLDSAPSSLRWRATPNATGYEVAILDIEGKVIWSSKSTATELALPDQARGSMLDRKTLFWRVEAFDARNASLSTSAPRRFRVVLPAH